jgi:hypothetical protein
MPILSDFTVVAENAFLFNGSNLDASFFTGGRHNSNAVLDVAALGGFRSGDSGMRLRVRLNSQLLETITVHRWESHSTVVFDRINVVIPPSVLRSSGANTLRIEPAYEGTGDYAFIGPVVCHFHQSD